MRFILNLLTSVAMIVSAFTLSAADHGLLEEQHRGVPNGKGVRILTEERDCRSVLTNSAYKQIGQSQNRSDFSVRKSYSAAFALTRNQLPVVPPMKSAGMNSLFGAVIAADSWTNQDKVGIYEFPTDGSSTVPTPVKLDKMLLARCAVYLGDTFWVTFKTSSIFGEFIMYITYDTATWEPIGSMRARNVDIYPVSLAWNETTNVVYGCFATEEDGNNCYWGTLDPNEDKATKIADLSTKLMAMAFVGNQLYAVDASGAFVTVDVTSGAVTTVGYTGLQPQYITSAAYDSRSGRYYYAQCSDTDIALYTIDLTSGVATKLYNMPDGEEILGMWVGESKAADAAPGVIHNFAAKFDNGSLTGTVEFDAPTTLYDGTPASGPLNYEIKVGEVSVSGATTYGSHVTQPVTVSAAGDYIVSAIVSNASGASPAVSSELWIGEDVPAPVSEVSVVYANGEFKISWPEAQSAHGGYIDRSALSYNVTRYPSETIVASGINVTSVTDNVAETDEIVGYSYKVAVVYNGSVVGEAESPTYNLGSLNPPYHQDFGQDNALDLFTVINANNDNYQWAIDDGAVRIQYNYSMPMDDWLILPPVKMEKGKFYELSFDASGSNYNYTEKFEVFVGKSPSVEAMTTCLLDVTELHNTRDDMEHFAIMFGPEEDGVYYLGIHGCSDTYQYYMYIDNINLSSGYFAGAPAAVSDFVVTPAPYGTLNATLSFTAPVSTVGGDRLSNLDKIEVYRNDELIGTVNPVPAPGTQVTYTDNNAAHGINLYRVVAYNEVGAGKEAVVSKYIGVAKPLPVTGVKVKNGNTTGEVVILWDPVTSDENGLLIGPEQVRYVVYRDVDEHMLVVADGLSECTVTETVCSPDAPQELVYYWVAAFTATGECEAQSSDFVPVGKPDEVPFAESFADGHLHYLWGVDYPLDGGVPWQHQTDEFGIASQDGDNGYIILNSPYRNYSGSIFSGNISIPAGMANPYLTFYYYNYLSKNTLDVLIDSGDGFKIVRTITLSSNEADEGWQRVSIPLDEYSGKNIRLSLTGYLNETTLIVVDNIRIATMDDNNITASDIVAPATVESGTDFTVNAVFENSGINIASGYTVDLYCNGEKVATQNGADILPDGKTIISFTQQANPFVADKFEYYAVVNWDNDELPTDNTTRTVTVRLVLPIYPVATDLKAETRDGGVALSWIKPDIESVSPEAVTDDVEAYVPFSIGLPHSEVTDDNMGDWTVIDGDNTLTYVLTGVSYPNANRQKSFMVFNDLLAGISNGSYSGDQMFICFNAISDEVPVSSDDWLISPRLSGHAQTIRFYARAITNDYPESMEVYYSTTDREKSSFTKVGGESRVPGSWTSYRYDLPEGAVWFAIRCNSVDQFALAVDDITYVPADPVLQNLKLTGYNVYRNGVKLNAELVDAESYVDTLPLTDAVTTYHVTAVYNEGESAPSNAAVIDNSGIYEVSADDKEALFFNLQGIRIDSPKSGNIYIMRRGAVTEKVRIK